MSEEAILAIILAVISSNAATAWISAAYSRRKSAAEAEHERMQVASLLIEQLQGQISKAFERINELEAEGKELRRTVTSQAVRIDELERLLRQAEVQYPPYMP